MTLLLATAPVRPPWRPDGVVDGMQVELREVPGSAYDEIRVHTRRDGKLPALCEAIFDGSPEKGGSFLRRDVFRRTARERWTYERIAIPLASDRDYVLHVEMDVPPARGRCEISFQTATDAAHPPVPGVVRIPVIRGHWSLAPAPEGGVGVTYQVYSDPGGSLPPFLVRGGQRRAAIDFLEQILARAK